MISLSVGWGAVVLGWHAAFPHYYHSSNKSAQEYLYFHRRMILKLRINQQHWFRNILTLAVDLQLDLCLHPPCTIFCCTQTSVSDVRYWRFLQVIFPKKDKQLYVQLPPKSSLQILMLNTVFLCGAQGRSLLLSTELSALTQSCAGNF